jgi:hypothetical protein
MAGHLPIKTYPRHITMVEEFLSNNDIDKMKDFETSRNELPRWVKLSKEYSMTEFDNLPEDDVYIIAYQMNDSTYEYHLNKDKEIIQIYLVM